MSKIFYFLFFISNLIYGQNKIEYGNNAEAGKYYKIRGINLYTEQYGEGLPLVMLHGNGGSIASMKSIIPYFAQRYKVIAIDSRAQGKSFDAADSISFEMMADDVADLLGQMRIDSAYVIGWSDGGITALLLAMRHSSKVAKLASSGANLWPDSTALSASFLSNSKKHYDAFRTKKLTSQKEKNDWKIFMLDFNQPNIFLDSLKEIQCPSLIICGDHDVIKLEHTVKIYQNILNAYLWVLPGSGHATLIEYPDEFDKKVNHFFMSPFVKR